MAPIYAITLNVLIWTFKQNFWLLENTIILIFKDGYVDLILFWLALSFLAIKRLFPENRFIWNQQTKDRDHSKERCLISRTSFIIHHSSVTS